VLIFIVNIISAFRTKSEALFTPYYYIYGSLPPVVAGLRQPSIDFSLAIYNTRRI